MTEETGFSEPEAPAEPVPVADQRAAGVPPEETVTVAEQRAGTPPPDVAAAAAEPAEAEPAAAAAEPEASEPAEASSSSSEPAAPEVPDNVPSWLREALNYIHERLRALGG